MKDEIYNFIPIYILQKNKLDKKLVSGYELKI